MKPSKGALARQAKADARAQAEAQAQARRRVINVTVAHDGWCLALHGGPCSCRPLVSSDATIEPEPARLATLIAGDMRSPITRAKATASMAPLALAAKEGKR